MRELHVVAVSDDGQSIVLATSRGATRGGYRVALDDRLTSAVLGDLLGGRPAGDVPPVDVTPKEIQARVRAGESVAAIAASAGVPIGKIERFAGPVLSEIARVLDEARAGYVSRSRLGASALPLGRAVDQHLAGTTGVRPETVTWSARREEAGTWLVQVSYVSQARRRTATWRYDVARREVTATDSPSAQLAHVEPGRAARGGAAPPPAAPASRATPTAKRVAPQSRRPASEPTRRTPPAARTVVARADAPHRAEVDLAAQARAQRAAAVQTAEADRALAAARAAERASSEHAAVRRAEPDAVDAQARRRAEAARTAKAEAARKAKAEAARTAKAEAARTAKAEAARTARAEAARKAKAEATRKAKADAARKARAEAARRAAAERKNAAAAVQEAAQLEREAEQARVDDAQVPSGPPTLRVVGGAEVPPRRRRPKPVPAAARAEPARVAGQRASVPGWADVLLSTAPVRSPEPEPERDQD